MSEPDRSDLCAAHFVTIDAAISRQNFRIKIMRKRLQVERDALVPLMRQRRELTEINDETAEA